MLAEAVERHPPAMGRRDDEPSRPPLHGRERRGSTRCPSSCRRIYLAAGGTKAATEAGPDRRRDHRHRARPSMHRRLRRRRRRGAADRPGDRLLGGHRGGGAHAPRANGGRPWRSTARRARSCPARPISSSCTKSVTEEQVAEVVPCGPDAARHLAKIAEYVDAGYDHVYVHQVGPDQAGFIKFAEGELLPALKPDALRLAS